MPALKEMPAAAQPAPPDLQLPPAFPRLPQDVLDRFPSMQKYQDDVDQWFDAFSQALTDANQNVTSVLNPIPGQITSLQTEIDDISPGSFNASAPVAIGTVDGVDGSGNPRKYMVSA